MEIHEPIDQKKKLNIIAIADASEYGKAAVSHGVKLAKVFQATLTVITRFGFSLEDRKFANDNANEIQTYLQRMVPSEEMTAVTWRNDYFFPERLYHYAEETNSIMFVIAVDGSGRKTLFNRRRAIRFIKPSRLPVMTVGKESPSPNAYEHVILPVDIERQAKEKALWAGYFSRFYQSTIHLLHTKYEDEGLQSQLHENLTFVEKLYHNLEVQYELNPVDPQNDMDLFSISFAESLKATLTVIMMTRYFTLADLLIGPHEKKVIGNAQGFPVLCINQRDDLYVLCT